MDTSKTNHVCLQLQNKMNLRKINISKYKKNDKIKKIINSHQIFAISIPSGKRPPL